MLDPDRFLWLAAPFSLPLSWSCSAGLLGYVGLGPGQEFIPQFVALLGLAAAAFLAILQWPITALLSRLSRTAAGEEARQRQTRTANTLERPSEANCTDS